MRKIDIASTIRSLITKRGISQKVVAEHSGFTEQQFTDMLKGRKIIRAEYLPRIARALGCALTDLYPGETGESPEGDQCPKSKFEITTRDAVDTTILMDGKDITKNALAVTYKHTAGEVPTVTVEYLADECTVRTLGELIVKKRKP